MHILGRKITDFLSNAVVIQSENDTHHNAPFKETFKNSTFTL